MDDLERDKLVEEILNKRTQSSTTREILRSLLTETKVGDRVRLTYMSGKYDFVSIEGEIQDFFIVSPLVSDKYYGNFHKNDLKGPHGISIEFNGKPRFVYYDTIESFVKQS